MMPFFDAVITVQVWIAALWTFASFVIGIGIAYAVVMVEEARVRGAYRRRDDWFETARKFNRFNRGGRR